MKKNIITKLRLWRIERALKIRLSKWQREFVFSEDWNIPPHAEGRRTGKTVAVNTKILMFYTGAFFAGANNDPINPLRHDTDYQINKRWHIDNLKRDWRKCKNHHIKVFEFTRPREEFT